MSPFGCYCASLGALCNDCLHEHFMWFAGIAYGYGEDWARAIENVMPVDRPWPMTAKMRAVAVRKASRLTSDARLLDMLVEQVIKGAARHWNAALAAKRDAG